eukprot:scaffold125613_cov35-Tisochrysis_lutea.AAC.3
MSCIPSGVLSPIRACPCGPAAFLLVPVSQQPALSALKWRIRLGLSASHPSWRRASFECRTSESRD